MFTPSMGVCGTGDLPRGVQHGAVAAEDQEQIHRAGQGGHLRQRRALQPREPGGDFFANHRASAAPDELRGGADTRGASGFLRVAHEADALEMVSDFFNQCQKFFVARRAEQGRFNHTAPAKASLRRDKLSQLRQHARMHGGVGDHAPALVRLRLAGLELRLDQRHDPSARLQQRHGGRQDFFQRNKGTVHHDELGGGSWGIGLRVEG